jgi:hypothetical protein
MSARTGAGIYLKTFSLSTGLLLILSACGVLSLGTGTPPNDPVPTGVVVYQAPFTALNKPVTGVVSVYRSGCYDSGNCIYVVRLQGITTPQESNILVIPTLNGTQALTPSQYTLRASSGNQNYTFTGVAASSSWTQVTLHPGASPAGQNDYATATLVATGNTGGTGTPSGQ